MGREADLSTIREGLLKIKIVRPDLNKDVPIQHISVYLVNFILCYYSCEVIVVD